jgi:hypothetical protein
MVLVTLQNPQEKFWDLLLSLDPGVNVRGVDLESLDDFSQPIKSAEAVSASVGFFAMHQAPRIEEDNRKGALPSLAEQFRAKTGVDDHKFFKEARK